MRSVIIWVCVSLATRLPAAAQNCDDTPRGCASLQALLAQLRSHDPLQRSEAAYRIAFLGDSSRPAIPLLARQAKADRDRDARRSAEEALGALGALAVPALTSLLTARDSTIAARAAELLGSAAPSDSLLAALAAALDRGGGILSDEAAYALAGFGRAARQLLISRMESPKATTRDAAVRAVKYLDIALSTRASERCYRLTRGQYAPQLDIGEDSVFSRVPSELYFSIRKYTGFWDPQRPAFRAETSADRQAWPRYSGAWIPRGDSVYVQFGMLSGILMTFPSVGDTLRGTVRTFWDFDRAEQHATLLGIRIPCR